jgi:4-amino-4-deoxy-L-arabinose transferase-like glycosyltransferase
MEFTYCSGCKTKTTVCNVDRVALQADEPDCSFFKYDWSSGTILSLMEVPKNSSKSNQQTLIIVGIAALAVRLVYLVLYQGLPDWDYLTVDNNYHHHWATTVASGNLVGDTTYFRAPLYAWLLGAAYALFGTSLWVGRILGMVIGSLTVIMTYLCAYRLFDRRVGLAATVLAAIYPISVYFEHELLLDALFTLFLLSSLYLFLRWRDTTVIRDLVWSGLLIGLASITRPTGLVAIPIMLVFVLFDSRRFSSGIGRGAILVASSLVIILPISIRNVVIAGDPVLIASQGGINFYIGNNESADGLSAILPEPLGSNWRVGDVTRIAEQTAERSLLPGEVSSYWYEEGVKWIKNNPSDFVTLLLRKGYYNISNREVSNNRSLELFFDQIWLLKYNPLSFGFLFSFAGIGAILVIRKRSSALPLIYFIGIYILATSLFFFSSRFRLPLIPLYCILSGYGILSLLEWIRQPGRALIWTCAGVVVLAAVSYLPLVPLPAGNSALSLNSRGLFYHDTGEYRKAAASFRNALSVDSLIPDGHLNLGATLFALGDIDQARYHFDREVTLHPDRSQAYTNLASLALSEGNAEQAIVLANKGIARRPDDPNGNLVLIRAASSLREIDADSLLAMIYGTLARTGDVLRLSTEASIMLSERGDLFHARELLENAVRARPPAIETDDAAFGRVWSNHPDLFEQRKARAFYQLGFLAGIEGDFQNAVTYSLQAIERDSLLTEAWVNLVTGYLSQGKFHMVDSLAIELEHRFPEDDNVRQLLRRISGNYP